MINNFFYTVFNYSGQDAERVELSRTYDSPVWLRFFSGNGFVQCFGKAVILPYSVDSKTLFLHFKTSEIFDIAI
jgi:hypothetical protein